MHSYLLTWNPKRWNWKTYTQDCASVARGGSTSDGRWSCGNSRSIEPGSEFFLIRLGLSPKGIIGRGEILTPPMEGPHWDLGRRGNGQTCWFVGIRFVALSTVPVITWDDLQAPELSGFHWASQSSGIEIRSPYSQRLNGFWEQAEQVETGPRLMKEHNEVFRRLAK